MQVRVEDDADDQPSSDGQHLADHLAMAFTFGRKRGKRRAPSGVPANPSKPTLLRRLFGRPSRATLEQGGGQGPSQGPSLPASVPKTVPPAEQHMTH